LVEKNQLDAQPRASAEKSPGRSNGKNKTEK